jgi:hypothetical protein
MAKVSGIWWWGYSCTAKPHQNKRATGVLLLQQGMEILSGELSEDEWEMLDELIVKLQKEE